MGDRPDRQRHDGRGRQPRFNPVRSENAGREDWVEQKEIVHRQQHDYSALRNEELLTVIELLAKVEGGIPPELVGAVETLRRLTVEETGEGKGRDPLGEAASPESRVVYVR